MAEENFREFLLAPFNPTNNHYNEEIPELNPQTGEQPQHGRRPRRKRNSAGNPGNSYLNFLLVIKNL